ncbi:hypothetical protein J6590_085709, partial [Homalodisca vitripennis]
MDSSSLLPRLGKWVGLSVIGFHKSELNSNTSPCPHRLEVAGQKLDLLDFKCEHLVVSNNMSTSPQVSAGLLCVGRSAFDLDKCFFLFVIYKTLDKDEARLREYRVR